MDLDLIQIKLVGDSTQYDATLKQAEAATAKATSGMTSTSVTGAKDIAAANAAAGKQMINDVANTSKATQEANASNIASSGRVVTALSYVSRAAGQFGSALVKASAEGATAVAGMAIGITGYLSSMVTSILPIQNLSFRGLWDQFREGMRSADELDRQARRVGATILDLRAGALWAGVSLGAMTSALNTTNMKLGELALGSSTVRREFQNLAALSNMTVAELSTGWPTVYDAISRIKDPTERAAQAFRFLGGDAAQFLSALETGGAGAAADLGKKFGLAITPADLEGIRTVQTFMRQLEAIQTGIFTQVLTGLAPIAAELTKVFDLTKVNLEWIKPTVVNIAESVAMFGAFMVEAATNSSVLVKAIDVVDSRLKAMALDFKAVMLETIDEIIMALNPLGNAIKSLGPKMGAGILGGLIAADAGLGTDLAGTVTGGSLTKSGKTAREEAEALRQRSATGVTDLSEVVKGSGPGKAVTDFFERVRAKSEGTGPAREGLSPALIDKLRQSFDSMTQSLRGPMDAWKQGLNDIRAFDKLGLFKGNEEQKNLMSFKLLTDLRSGVGASQSPQFASGADFGSKEAQSAILQYQALGRRQSVEDEIKNLTEIANAQREAMKLQGERVAAALEAMKKKDEDEEEIDF